MLSAQHRLKFIEQDSSMYFIIANSLKKIMISAQHRLTTIEKTLYFVCCRREVIEKTMFSAQHCLKIIAKHAVFRILSLRNHWKTNAFYTTPLDNH